ncbi:MAG: FadR family transcriptional regulator [Neomegalonema sp.]|nr:FadR family transcriptional regulator [Neomegalonema sp.]
MDKDSNAAPRQPGLADQVYDELLRCILDGAHPVNSRLPTEAELARKHGVSRPIVRTALSRLRDDGIIESRRGSGSYVRKRPVSNVAEFISLGSISDIQRCYDFRVDVEGAAAAWAARKRDDQDIVAIEEAFDLMDQRYAEQQDGVDADAQLHLAIVRASKNPFFISVQEALASQISFGMTLSRSLSMPLGDARQRLVQAEHRTVIDAIVAEEAAAAQNAMRAHIEAARSRMFEGDEALRE